ncbi:phosphoadenosine phosphosulfate reductase family protein [Ruegeria sp.]|uniref:phosphoadenosine phosphosulfate reductase domain-containing protein n=1 Tax=Ruegeria sp. TaxID=1879320 RepID=UPI003B59E62F
MSPTDPFRLPEGPVQIAFSGGRSSAFMLHQLLTANNGLPDRVRVIFTNTGREMPQTLDFVAECGARWGVDIVWLEYRYEDAPMAVRVDYASASRKGEPFAALIRRKRHLPNPAARFCTAELKVRTAKRWLVAQGWQHWVSALGIRADEPRRLNTAPDRQRWTTWYPLAAAGVSRHDVARFWAARPFDLALPNLNGRCWLGNCDGCFLKSEADLAALARDYPERHRWWEEMEALAARLSNRPEGARFRKEYSRAGLRDFVDRQGDWIFETEGALCQASGGECL